MSQKVKLFYDSSPIELEQHVNNWLEENPEVEVIQMTQQIDSFLELSGGASAIWDGLSFISLLYRVPSVEQ